MLTTGGGGGGGGVGNFNNPSFVSFGEDDGSAMDVGMAGLGAGSETGRESPTEISNVAFGRGVYSPRVV
jgi:hypothetical protein